MADSFIVESVFEIAESLVDEDEPELLHAENRKAILAKNITGFMVLSFTTAKFSKTGFITKKFPCVMHFIKTHKHLM